MERLDELETYIRDYWEELIQRKKIGIQKQEPQLTDELCKKLNVLIEQQLLKQAEDQERKIQYLFLCQMKSSYYTGSYEVMLGLCNTMIFLDEDKSYAYWYPKPIFETIEVDMATVTNQLRKKFIRLEHYELFYLKQQLLQDYWEILNQTYIKMGDRIDEIIVKSSLVLNDSFFMLSGNYMDMLKIVRRENNIWA